MKNYRDKFVAHDEAKKHDLLPNHPFLDIAVESSYLYYSYVREKFWRVHGEQWTPANLRSYCDKIFSGQATGTPILLGSGGAEKERAQLPGSRPRCHDRAPLGQVGEGRHRSHPQYGEPASSSLERHDREERFAAATARRSRTVELAARPAGCPAREARRSGAPSMRSAQQVQTAVAIELLLQVPMRLTNLCGLRIGVHLLRGSGKQMFISIPPHEIKNEVALEASLPDAAATLIAIYLERYRPLLTKAGGDWLFPGARLGTPKTEMGLRAPMQKVLATRCGLRFNPHLFRHMAAWLTLRQNPDAHGQVQRILGHKSLTATMTFYSGLEGPAALQHYDRLVSDLRDAALVRGPRKRRLGVGG
jgi:integrase